MKIKIITSSPIDTMGGIQKYVNSLEKIFKDEYDIETIQIRPNYENYPKVLKENNTPKKEMFPRFSWSRRGIIKNIERMEKDKEVKAIIMNCEVQSEKLLRSNKVIWVQHTSQERYVNKYNLQSKTDKLKEWFDFLFLKSIYPKKHFITNAKNVVFYDKTSNVLDVTKNPIYIPLSNLVRKDCLPSSKRKGTIWLSRLTKEKGTDALINADKLKRIDDLVIYGDGPESKAIKEHFRERWGGALSHDEVNATLNKHKIYMHTLTGGGGFEYTIVEALTNGVPVISFNSFASHKFYSQTPAFSYVKNGDIKAYREKMDEILSLSDEEYDKLSNEAITFSKKYLSQEAFAQNWKKVIERI